MRLLALDTATRATAVAVCDGDRAVEARDDPPVGARPGHARRLLPLAAQALQDAGFGWSELDAVVVGRGPGTFTGLRIGIASARGLATSLGVPLLGVSSLEALAHPALDVAGGPVVAVIDARRRELFLAVWDGHGDPLGPPRVARPDELDSQLAELENPLAVGDGAVEWREALERAGATVPPDDSELHRVTARAHCRLARVGPGPGPEGVLPDYLRLPDAELARRAADDGTR